MIRVPNRLKPTNGFAHFFHIGFLVLLPVVLFILIRIRFVQLGFALILLSKWRMFAVRPRYWLAFARQNAVDIMVGLSLFVFMAQTTVAAWQLLWAVTYAVWLLVIRPGSSTLSVSLQAFIAQFVTLMAVFLTFNEADVVLFGVALPWSFMMVLSVGMICYLAARHFYTSFDEPYSSLYSHAWGYFAAALTWILTHWLLFYGNGLVAQPTLLLSVLGFGLGALYYLDERDRLSKGAQRQIIFLMAIVVVVVLSRSDWSSKII